MARHLPAQRSTGGVDIKTRRSRLQARRQRAGELRATPPVPVEVRPLVCPRCHAVSLGWRWFLDEPRFQQYLQEGSATFVTCPGCRKVDGKLYDGDVVLRSPLLARNKEQALQMIRRLEAAARQENPVSRIGVLHDRGDEVGILTTDTWLARRIGREFQRAFGGDTTYQWSGGEKFVRVRWERPE